MEKIPQIADIKNFIMTTDNVHDKLGQIMTI